MNKILAYCISFLLLSLLAFSPTMTNAADIDIMPNRTIKIPKTKDTVYHLLGKVSDITGLLFIYDSKIIDNEKVTTIKKGNYTIEEAIRLIVGNANLEVRQIGNHILITLPVTQKNISAPTIVEKKNPYFTIEGTIIDKHTNEPIEGGTINVQKTSIGSVSNANGEFRLIIPDSLLSYKIVFSHLGYIPEKLDASIMTGRKSTIGLEAKVIPLQEVIVRIANPVRLLREMQQSIKTNYSRDPVYLTSFYREGIERKNKFVSLSEAIFKIYKSSYLTDAGSDQVKLLKMRNISNQLEEDTVITKMKAGINSSLMLDVIKTMPDFLNPDDEYNLYNYVSTDITVIDNRIVNVIAFEQKENVDNPLYRGELYIDSENNALIRATFEINPRYIDKATNMFIEKKSKDLNITLQKVEYTLSYKQWNTMYYINHVRGDLYFKIKKRKQLFSSFPLHTWFEMVTCKIDTHDISRFTHNETLPTRTIFADTHFTYDENFWENFNVIPPEKKLNEEIGEISIKVEETGY